MYKNKTHLDHASQRGADKVDETFNMAGIVIPHFSRKPHAISSQFHTEVCLSSFLFICFKFTLDVIAWL